MKCLMNFPDDKETFHKLQNSVVYLKELQNIGLQCQLCHELNHQTVECVKFSFRIG